MYNDFEIGSYLLFDPAGGYPRHLVFVDPRLPAYPIELHRLLGRSDLTRAEWSAAMDGFGVETALLAYAGVNPRVSSWDPDRYALVFREGDARVFVRRLPRFAALIARHEIPATFSFSPQEGTATLPMEDRPAASPVPDCEWQRRLGDLTSISTGHRRRARWPPTIARWRRRPVVSRQPTRRGSAPGWARSRWAWGAPRTRCRCWIARSRAAMPS